MSIIRRIRLMMMNMDKHPKIILLDSGLCSAGEKGFGMISLIPGMRIWVWVKNGRFREPLIYMIFLVVSKDATSHVFFLGEL